MKYHVPNGIHAINTIIFLNNISVCLTYTEKQTKNMLHVVTYKLFNITLLNQPKHALSLLDSITLEI